MRAKLTLVRSEGRKTDLVLGAEATATVGDVATALFAADPLHRGRPTPDRLTLSVADDHSGRAARLLDAGVDLYAAGLRSGSVIEVTRPSDEFTVPGEDRGPVAAVVRVLAGPDAGRDFPVPSGSSTVGRDRDVDVRLSDPLISKRHCRINVTGGVEILDTNSANGVVIGHNRVARASIAPGDLVVLGDTTLIVVPIHHSTGIAGSPAAAEFNRSPRVVRRFPPRDVPHPKPPEPPASARFPFIAMIAPLIMGAVLWFATHQLLSLVFVGLSPLMMLGSWVDQRSTARRTLRAQSEQFTASVAAVEEHLEREHAVERAVRLAATPSVTDAVDAIERLGRLLWTMRPEHREFLTVRLGVGSARSALTMRLPESSNTRPEDWARLADLAARTATVEGVPVVADLRVAGSIGVAGEGDLAREAATGLVLQLVTLHSPTDLTIACTASRTSRTAWEWLDWLPHVGNPAGPLGGVHLADNPGAAALLVERLEAVVEARLTATPDRGRGWGPLDDDAVAAVEPTPLPAVVVVVEDDSSASRSRLVRLAERGPQVGVHLVWVAADVAALPAACRAFLTVAAAGSTAGQVRVGGLHHPVEVQRLSPAEAMRLARLMSCVVDSAGLAEDESDLPRTVAYSALTGSGLLDDPREVVARWQESESVIERGAGTVARRRQPAVLSALVGIGASAPVSIDLRLHGPHALVGGTTGAGKSEFLQTWVLGMAQANSPDRLAFLFVDYKGGTAFADCTDLPHTVGLVTDLSPHLVRRALTSLRAEIRYREHLLNRKEAKDLVVLERTGDPECPPSLVIVVDEFAALATDVPEFVDGVVDIAQRGRSLGLHLILATQRPAGVIRDNLRANTNLRVALRLADADDSTDILGVPDAAHFDPSTPGRGAIKTGPGRIVAFQTGYAGGWTSSAPAPPQIDIAEMAFGSGPTWEVPREAVAEEVDPGPSDMSRMVTTIRAAARVLQIPDPRRPWLDELASTYDFARLPNPRTDTRLVLGVADDPAQQAQPTFAYEPDRDGNLAVYGAGGSGKSATLRTIAVAAATTARGGPVHVYGLDFGSHGLQSLAVLPHVAAIVDGDDQEGLSRVLRRIKEAIDDRASRFAAARADSLSEYRNRAERPDEPRILLLVDGISAFRDAYEYATPAEFAVFSQIAADGRAVGVHVVVTGDRPNAVPMSIASTIQRRLVLRLSTEDEYLLLNTPKDVLSSSSPPGRGVLDGNEVQVAILGGSSNLAVQARELGRLAEAMTRNGVVPAPPITRLGSRIALSSLAASLDDRLVVGVDDETLASASLDARGPFMVSGPPGSGRTTALATLAAAVRRLPSRRTTLLFSPRRSSIAGTGLFDTAASSPDDAATAARQWSAAMAAGDVAPGSLVVFLETLADFTGTAAEPELGALVKACLRADHLVIAEAESSTWKDAYTLGAPFKAGRRGLLLTPGETEGDVLLATPLGRFRRDMPPGRGFLVGGGRGRRIQVAEVG